jgi:RimJ/RimL family protein N-acetyltransferase
MAARRNLVSMWPLFGLELRSERLELRYPTDADVAALLEIARGGIHDEGVQPFENGWTDRPAHEFGPGFARYFWAQRAGWRRDSWALPLGVYLDGEPIGVQQVTAEQFPALRTVGTGSWLARRYHGIGIGTEMRAAALWFAFECLDADFAITAAYAYSSASLGVSRKIGYTENGSRLDVVRGVATEARLFRLSRAVWDEAGWPEVQVRGFEPCRELFGDLERSDPGRSLSGRI